MVLRMISFAVQEFMQGKWIHLACRAFNMFIELLPSTFPIGRLDKGHGIEAAMVANKAQYHHMQYNEVNCLAVPFVTLSSNTDSLNACADPSWCLVSSTVCAVSANDTRG